MLTRIVAIILFVVAPSLTTSGQEWTRFRGPNGTGISDAANVPAKWSDEDYNWTADLPGKGISSPVIWGRKLFVTASDEDADSRFLICLNTGDGKELWKKDFEFSSYKKHKNNSFASSTPCVDKDHVYVAWHSRESSPLIAFDHEGNEVWTYELGPYLHGQGGATSPIVYENLVVMANDQKSPSFLVAVDRMTGKQAWKIPREGKRACYATPCVFRSRDRDAELIFTHCYEGVIGVDPKSGTQNWHADVFGRSSQRALGSPVFTDDLVIATSGAVGGDRQLVAIRPSADSDTVTATEAYRTTKQTPHVPTPVVYEDWLFLLSDQGFVSCLEKTTGDEVWKQRLGGTFFSSPICVGGKLYCVDINGRVSVVAASDEYELFARNELGEGSKATPAVSDGVLFLRTDSKVFSIGGE